MKKFSILKLFSIVALGAAGAFAVAGALSSKKAEAVKAETYSGSVYLQLNTNDWKATNSKVGLYLFNSDGSKNSWGNLISPDGSTKYYQYTWSELDFEPTKAIMMRVNSSTESWGSGIWDSDDLWARTNNIDLNDVVWGGNYYENSKYCESGSYSLEVSIKGGSADNWETPTVNVKLSNVKVTNDKFEVYGQVTIPANTYFKAHKTADDQWYGTYEAHPSISSHFETSAGGNIKDKVGGTYEIYFKYDDGSTLYITDPVKAAADEWAQSFTSGGCSTTKTNWSTLAGTYNGLSADAKALFVAEAHIAHDAEAGSFIAAAVQRYDYVIERYGTNPYTDFMGRVDAGKVTPKVASADLAFNNPESSNLIVIVSIVSLISASTLIGLIVIKRRRGIAK